MMEEDRVQASQLLDFTDVQLEHKVDVPVRLKITEKGIDEIERRTHKLSIRKRSVLVQLNEPRTLAYILGKSVFHQDEIIYEIKALEHEGFLAMDESLD